MQPTMVITAPGSGMIYLNGHFAGETNENMPLMRAVNPTGAVYIEFHPLDSRHSALSRRLVFSGGYPMRESADEAEDMRIICWPGKISEIELLPTQTAEASPMMFEAGGRSLIIDSRCRLMLGRQMLLQLPENAGMPTVRQLGQSTVLTGDCREGQYLVVLDESTAAAGFLAAKQIELEADGRIRALVERGDSVGHASLENWRLEREGLRMISSENVWADGAPHWPQTALETICAAFEAEAAGLYGEAEGYLSPALRQNSPLKELTEAYDLCTEMKYALPDGRACAALIRLESAVLAQAVPLYYQVSASGGTQGPYQIEGMDIGTVI